MAKFDSNDDSVVLIVGSGTGVDTLANKMCAFGVRCVMLVAGDMQSQAQLYQ